VILLITKEKREITSQKGIPAGADGIETSGRAERR
jgi:hypothetical protein